MVQPLTWMRAVRDASPKFSAAREHVLMMLGLRMGPNGTGFASHPVLGADAQRDERTAQRATADARSRGYLVQTRRGHRVTDDTVLASEWALTCPVNNPTQPDTGAALGPDPTRQNTRPNTTEHPTQHDTGVVPRGPHQEVLTKPTAILVAIRDELIQTTGREYDDEWCKTVEKAIFNGQPVGNRENYARACIRKDPSRYTPTSQPPRYRAGEWTA